MFQATFLGDLHGRYNILDLGLYQLVPEADLYRNNATTICVYPEMLGILTSSKQVGNTFRSIGKAAAAALLL